MKKEMNSEKLRVNSTERKRSEGITLIALIITIIILIILAMVSVRIVTDSNITKHAENAADTYTVEQEKELIGVGYSNYRLEKYSPSEAANPTDYEYLQTYFLGEDKQGLTGDELTQLVIPEDSSDTSLTFNNGIVFTENNRVENQEKDEVQYYFEYNGNSYQLITNLRGDTKTKAVEIVPTLKVEGAQVTGDETSGWKIIFDDTGNIYDLLADGTITNKWWELTEEESEQLFITGGNYFIATAGFDTRKHIILSPVWQNYTENQALIIYTDNRIYFFVLNDEFAQEVSNRSGKTVNAYQWYYTTDDSDISKDPYQYDGPAPIQKEDYQEIYCESYLDRIIDSFNN